jgi:hypothetical protein
MTDKSAPPERFSISRWSRRKLAANVEASAPQSPVPTNAMAAAPASASSPAPVAAELPSIDSLGFDSDFTAFLRPEVDEKLKRAALKQLFRDPRFNVMDGLDTYIDDYTKADPIPADVLKDLLQRGFSAAAPAAPSPDETAPREAIPSTGPAAEALPAAPSPAALPQSKLAAEDAPEEPSAPSSSS